MWSERINWVSGERSVCRISCCVWPDMVPSLTARLRYSLHTLHNAMVQHIIRSLYLWHIVMLSNGVLIRCWVRFTLVYFLGFEIWNSLTYWNSSKVVFLVLTVHYGHTFQYDTKTVNAISALSEMYLTTFRPCCSSENPFNHSIIIETYKFHWPPKMLDEG